MDEQVERLVREWGTPRSVIENGHLDIRTSPLGAIALKMRWARDNHGADTLVSEVFAHLVKNPPTETVRNPGSYLKRTMRNIVSNIIRNKKRHPIENAKRYSPRLHDRAHREKPGIADDMTQADRDALHRITTEALAALPTGPRTAWSMKMSGSTFRQIAVVLGCSESMSRKHHQAAADALAATLLKNRNKIDSIDWDSLTTK